MNTKNRKMRSNNSALSLWQATLGCCQDPRLALQLMKQGMFCTPP